MIDSKFTYKINGFPIKVHLWCSKKENPILLFVHGGPGNPFRHKVKEHMLPLLDHYTIVAYDQRGCGGSYRPYIRAKDITVENLVDDLIVLSEKILDRLNQEKLYLIAESFGSYVSTKALLKRPDLYCGYFGYGQLVDDMAALKIQYHKALDAAEKVGDKKSYNLLRKMGLPKGKRGKDSVRFFSIFYPLMERDMDSYEEREIKPFLESDEYSRLEKRSMEAWNRLYRKVINNLLNVTLLTENLHFDCPYYIVGGKKDYITPFELDEGYLEKVDAPKKELIVFPNCGHISAFENPKRFMKELRKRLR